jgi:hypothetical protein
MQTHNFTHIKKVTPIPLKLESSNLANKKNKKEIWTLVKLKNNKYHVVSSEGKIIKIDEVYREED